MPHHIRLSNNYISYFTVLSDHNDVILFTAAGGRRYKMIILPVPSSCYPYCYINFHSRSTNALASSCGVCDCVVVVERKMFSRHPPSFTPTFLPTPRKTSRSAAKKSKQAEKHRELLRQQLLTLMRTAHTHVQRRIYARTKIKAKKKSQEKANDYVAV